MRQEIECIANTTEAEFRDASAIVGHLGNAEHERGITGQELQHADTTILHDIADFITSQTHHGATIRHLLLVGEVDARNPTGDIVDATPMNFAAIAGKSAENEKIANRPYIMCSRWR